MAGLVLKDNSRRYLAVANNELEKAIARVTIKVQREALRLVSQHKSPPPSPATGDSPPHLDTGTLARSIQSETWRDRMTGDFFGRVGTNIEYGGKLEEGTSRMAPRPWLRPALTSQEKTLKIEVGRALRKAARRRR